MLIGKAMEDIGLFYKFIQGSSSVIINLYKVVVQWL